MGTERQRGRNLRATIDTIKLATSQGLKVDRSKMEAEICIEHGLTRRKAKEYTQLLIDAGRIAEQDGKLTAIDS